MIIHRASSSGGSVALRLRLSFGGSRVPFGVALLPEALTRFARNVLFIPLRLQKQAFDTPGNKKPGEILRRASGSRLYD